MNDFSILRFLFPWVSSTIPCGYQKDDYVLSINCITQLYAAFYTGDTFVAAVAVLFGIQVWLWPVQIASVDLYPLEFICMVIFYFGSKDK